MMLNDGNQQKPKDPKHFNFYELCVFTAKKKKKQNPLPHTTPPHPLGTSGPNLRTKIEKTMTDKKQLSLAPNLSLSSPTHVPHISATSPSSGVYT